MTAVLGADAASIFLADEDGELVLRRPRPRAGRPGGAAARSATGFAGRVAATREALVSHDAAADLDDPALRPLDVDSLVGVPLLAEGEVTGVLIACAGAPRRLTPEDLGMLRLAADRVALGIDRARVYEREHRIAETLQRSLLPDGYPNFPGLDVAARYLPAASEARWAATGTT